MAALDLEVRPAAPAAPPTSLTLSTNPPINPAVRTRPHHPLDLWVRCENSRCAVLLYTRELERNLRVCPQCQHHFRLGATERIAQLVDPGSFEEHDADAESADPLRFVSAGQSYRDKLGQTQLKTRLREAIVCGSATLRGCRIELAVMDFGFLGGSMGAVVGHKLVQT
ncbi:MAG: acetyl-CoA carboxylase carboxyl transferase subunit beta, partial [Chloroflexota bacterium]